MGEDRGGSKSGWLPGLPLGAVRRLDREVGDRLSKAPLRLNEFGFDPYGFNPAVARRMMRPTSVDPVKAILPTPWWFTSASPAL